MYLQYTVCQWRFHEQVSVCDFTWKRSGHLRARRKLKSNSDQYIVEQLGTDEYLIVTHLVLLLVEIQY